MSTNDKTSTNKKQKKKLQIFDTKSRLKIDDCEIVIKKQIDIAQRDFKNVIKRVMKTKNERVAF